jgi:hypothetical protein
VLSKSFGWQRKIKPKILRERWFNHLNPCLSKEPWTAQEDHQLFELVEKFGPRWSKLARKIKIRNEHQVKNRYLQLSKKHQTEQLEMLGAQASTCNSGEITQIPDSNEPTALNDSNQVEESLDDFDSFSESTVSLEDIDPDMFFA